SLSIRTTVSLFSQRSFDGVAVRQTGFFCISAEAGKIDGISHKHCKNLQHSDGYAYLQTKQKEERFLPVLKNEVSALSRG
ncbi:MAG: hypothetical protein V4489_00855, partial [Chlamydiota bacterium]